MRNTLEDLITSLIDHSIFFQSWKPGQIDPELSKRFLITFDTLVQSFPALIALGASRMKNETARTALAVNLYQECGEGDVTRSHHAIYRKFLTTADISLTSLIENDFAAEWRTSLFDYINRTPSTGAVLGVLAAGEFLAQPALSRIYAVIEPHYPQADQEYFTKHLVLEEEHVKEITAIIALEAKNEAGWQEVLNGFQFGLSVWEKYFNHLAQFVTASR
ncbi:MAG TPA: iron-containing redox enzyme family protein [bacterium]|nr:iron-containing redox enzyme family protein [bacterium]